MSTYEHPDELQGLLEDYISETINEHRFRRLEEILLVSEPARAYFIRHCRMETDLHLLVRSRMAADRAMRAIHQHSPATSRPAHVIPFPQPALRRYKRPFVFASAAAAVLLCALLLTLWLTRRDSRLGSHAEDIAWLVNAQNCQWLQDSEPAGGLLAGQFIDISGGLAEIRFASGATAILEGPASLELLTGNSARLVSGKVAAHVPEQAHGFQVFLPQGKLIDLGTEFGVQVSDDGSAQVYVFEGKVQASSNLASLAPLDLRAEQFARISSRELELQRNPPPSFVRAIAPPPAIVARTLALDFTRPAPQSLRDRNGLGVGLTHRLPGTGGQFSRNDPNLFLDAANGDLELTTTRSDLNLQHGLDQGEYLGVRLADLGFTGKEDFEISVAIPGIPSLRALGQFGLYAGMRSDYNIRGGLISAAEPNQYEAFLVNNKAGQDNNFHSLGMLSTGNDLRLTLRRTAGRFALSVENLSVGNASSLTIPHPAYLDNQPDLYLGIFGANTQSDARRTLIIRDLKVTVWTQQPAREPTPAMGN